MRKASYLRVIFGVTLMGRTVGKNDRGIMNSKKTKNINYNI